VRLLHGHSPRERSSRHADDRLSQLYSAEFEAAALLPAFRQGLREIGYVEGQTSVK
jgi:hypothetical protein